jgi:hypothetical protein
MSEGRLTVQNFFRLIDRSVECKCDCIPVVLGSFFFFRPREKDLFSLFGQSTLALLHIFAAALLLQ